MRLMRNDLVHNAHFDIKCRLLAAGDYEGMARAYGICNSNILSSPAPNRRMQHKLRKGTRTMPDRAARFARRETPDV